MFIIWNNINSRFDIIKMQMNISTSNIISSFSFSRIAKHWRTTLLSLHVERMNSDVWTGFIAFITHGYVMVIMIVPMVLMSQLISAVIWMELGSVLYLKFPVQSMALHAELINFNVTVDSAFLVIYNALESLNVMMNLTKSNAVSTNKRMPTALIPNTCLLFLNIKGIEISPFAFSQQLVQKRSVFAN